MLIVNNSIHMFGGQGIWRVSNVYFSENVCYPVQKQVRGVMESADEQSQRGNLQPERLQVGDEIRVIVPSVSLAFVRENRAQAALDGQRV